MRRVISHVIYISTPFIYGRHWLKNWECPWHMIRVAMGLYVHVCVSAVLVWVSRGAIRGRLIGLWGCRGVVSPLWEPVPHKTNLCRLAATVCIAYTVLIYFRTLITCLLEFLCEYTYNLSICMLYICFVYCERF